MSCPESPRRLALERMVHTAIGRVSYLWELNLSSSHAAATALAHLEEDVDFRYLLGDPNPDLSVLLAASEIDSPAPWTVGKGYEQSSPGFYVSASNGRIVVASQDGTDCTLSRADAQAIVGLRNAEVSP